MRNPKEETEQATKQKCSSTSHRPGTGNEQRVWELASVRAYPHDPDEHDYC